MWGAGGGTSTQGLLCPPSPQKALLLLKQRLWQLFPHVGKWGSRLSLFCNSTGGGRVFSTMGKGERALPLQLLLSFFATFLSEPPLPAGSEQSVPLPTFQLCNARGRGGWVLATCRSGTDQSETVGTGPPMVPGTGLRLGPLSGASRSPAGGHEVAVCFVSMCSWGLGLPHSWWKTRDVPSLLVPWLVLRAPMSPPRVSWGFRFGGVLPGILFTSKPAPKGPGPRL